MGHFDPFPPPRLNGRCPFSWPTSAGASGNGEDAQEAAIRVSAIARCRQPRRGGMSHWTPTYGERETSTCNGHFGRTCYHPLFCSTRLGDVEATAR
jgi:hypothetical protein